LKVAPSTFEAHLPPPVGWCHWSENVCLLCSFADLYLNRVAIIRLQTRYKGAQMDILLISGFLGSGKTTMILSTIDEIIKRKHKKVVVIVNDFGQIGIDGKVMEKYGLEVREMPSGCICCTLGSDLLATLRDVANAFHPDLVVIEPTGVADPEAIHDTLKLYRGPIGTTRIVIIVDAVRYPVIMKALARPLQNQLKAANVIIINKVDGVGDEDIKSIEQSFRDQGLSTKVIAASATTGMNLDQVVEAMVG